MQYWLFLYTFSDVPRYITSNLYSKYALKFQEQLTTGDIVCLSTPLVARDGQRGSWSSSDPSLVAVDRATGIGQVIGNRAGQIAIGHSLHPAASLQMQVVAANELVVLATDAEAGQLTNAPGASVLRLPVVVRNSRDGEKLSNLVSTNYVTSRNCYFWSLLFPVTVVVDPATVSDSYF